jgi:hypothetical protein
VESDSLVESEGKFSGENGVNECNPQAITLIMRR